MSRRSSRAAPDRTNSATSDPEVGCGCSRADSPARGSPTWVRCGCRAGVVVGVGIAPMREVHNAREVRATARTRTCCDISMTSFMPRWPIPWSMSRWWLEHDPKKLCAPTAGRTTEITVMTAERQSRADPRRRRHQQDTGRVHGVPMFVSAAARQEPERFRTVRNLPEEFWTARPELDTRPSGRARPRPLRRRRARSRPRACGHADPTDADDRHRRREPACLNVLLGLVGISGANKPARPPPATSCRSFAATSWPTSRSEVATAWWSCSSRPSPRTTATARRSVSSAGPRSPPCSPSSTAGPTSTPRTGVSPR